MEKVFEFKKANKVKVTIDDHFLRINRKGFVSAVNVGLSGEKAFNLDDITSVQLKKPGFTSGYIQFSLPGGNEGAGVFNAVKDENSILFSKTELPLAEEIKSIVESHIKNRGNKDTNIKPDPTKPDPTEELRKYKSLLDDGIITQEEFDAKKKQLLDL
ncbi:hypothetical protein NG54_03180 [Heyndrickxia ginsengihumi]|uniref:SHOCT domain-containing protein n=1 Tax=Heyndrickxia ginsengihumi TaxID=363870 RepID=A0A0A6VDL7_9BACI|nr:SHOCT domain-containing protein [Heyndrickxia ginsengihumi]KHD86340.1 hypothetical protein NG54_03180 [Heyndrickxia ginsengihumi]